VTNPDKTPIEVDTPFTPWSGVELLKRGFVEIDGIVYAPLQKKVIEDSLHWVGKKSRAHNIAADTVRSALLEAALHGQEYYTLMYNAVKRACQLAHVKFEPVSYEQVRGMYL